MDRAHNLSSHQHIVHGPWNRKSITTILSQQQQQQQHHCSAAPSYSLWDLVSVGVGGTVGSGIFVLTGYINNHYAGPATFLSFVVSGFAAFCSGISFAEFSGRLPRIEGSTYT
jgi:amino acid permease